MSDFVFLNGQLLPHDDARIAPSDAGFLHGAGLFETMHARHGKVFRLADHLARLTHSAEALGINLSLSLPQLQEMITDLLDANDLAEQGRDARLRLTITRGDLHAATAQDSALSTPDLTLLLTAAPFTPYPAALYEKGLTVVISPYTQNPESPLTGHKTTSYLDRLLALRDAQQRGAGEALWFTAHANYLAEGSISNVFLVDAQGTLITPPLTIPARNAGVSPAVEGGEFGVPPLGGVEGGEVIENRKSKIENPLCLPGITRKLVLELATALNLLPHERLVTIHDLLAAKEIFLTNAIMGVMPVTHLEQHKIADEKPGDLTRQLMAAYTQRLAAETV